MTSYIITSASGLEFSYDAETQAEAIRMHTAMYPLEGVQGIVAQTEADARATME